jgi:hypothetical protein
MPPIVTHPASGETVVGKTYTLTWVNAHGIHPPKTVTKWRFTIGTQAGLNDKYDSGLLPAATLFCTCNSMPADGNSYFAQVEWTGNNPGLSFSNQFRST